MSNFGTKTKVAVLLSFILFASLGVAAGLKAVNSWFNGHYFKFNKVLEVKVNKPMEIKKREVEAKEIVKIIEAIPNPQDLETDYEKKIYELWGIENYRIAIAVAKAESNMNCDALNINVGGSADFSIFQVNSLWIKNYSLSELADCNRNIEIAYEIWDNGDRELGNNKGSWNPWVTAKNGAYLKFLE